MLGSLVKSLLRQRTHDTAAPARTPLRLHIGGKARHPEWKIVDALEGPHVDYVRSCSDLSIFANGSVQDVYASHVIEHLGYQSELAAALSEFHRVLSAGGLLRISVPDLSTLCTLFVDPALNIAERFHVMRMMFGGQLDSADFHRVGLNEELLTAYLAAAGFAEISRVAGFGLFEDTSSLQFRGRAISINLEARKRDPAI